MHIPVTRSPEAKSQHTCTLWGIEAFRTSNYLRCISIVSTIPRQVALGGSNSAASATNHVAGKSANTWDMNCNFRRLNLSRKRGQPFRTQIDRHQHAALNLETNGGHAQITCTQDDSQQRGTVHFQCLCLTGADSTAAASTN